MAVQIVLEDQARTLIRALLGSSLTPADAGPWQRALAGGRRYIALRSTVNVR